MEPLPWPSDSNASMPMHRPPSGSPAGVPAPKRARILRGLAPVVLAAPLVGCDPAPTEFHGMYAEIVAEEDARGTKGLSRIHTFLGHDDPAARSAAVRALGRLEDPAHIARLAPILDDPDASVRAAAALALAQSARGDGSGAALDALAGRVATEDDPSALGSLATHLGRLSPSTSDEGARIERSLLDVAARLPPPHADPGLVGRVGVARGLEAMARPGPAEAAWSEALGDLARALSHFRAEGEELQAARVRRLATAALVHAGVLSADEVMAGLDDPDWGVRRHVILAAGRYGTAYGDAIPAGLEDPDPHVRVDALRAFDRWMRQASGCGVLLTMAADADSHVALTALDLARRPCRDRGRQLATLSAIAGELDDSAAAWHRPAAAIHALAGLAPGDARGPILRLAGHASPFARSWAARSAAEAGAVTVLEALSEDGDANVRTAALQGLARLAGAAPTERYEAQLEADDPQLVMTAARLLAGSSTAGPSAAPALLTSLARFTEARRETTRDVRMAIFDALAGLGGFGAADLEPYLRDYDPAVAARASDLLESTTGVVHAPDPRPLPPLPPPDASRIQELERSTVVLTMAGLGEIVVALRPDLAATNADRFARLASEGYFDGLTFHRVEPNFVIQGGSPNANEFTGDGLYSRDEIGDMAHWRGTVGLSTRGRDTGDAQIFINLVDNVRLDFDYTIYGVVVEGMDVVDRVVEGSEIERARVGRAAR